MPRKKKVFIRFDRLLDQAQEWAEDNHMDDSSSVFVRNLVQQTLKKIYERKFKGARWLNDKLVPISTEVSEGASEYGYQELGELGEADIISEAATDFPVADVEGAYTLHRVHPVGTSFRYTNQDVRKAQLQGTIDLVPRKSAAARKVWDRKIDDLIVYGSKKHNFDGITNAKGIRVDVLTTGGWLTATGVQIVADLTAVYASIEDETDSALTPDTLVLPIDIMRRLKTVPYDSATPQITILKYLQMAFPEITTWAQNSKLSTAAEDGTAAGMLYSNDPDNLVVQIPMPLRPIAPEQRGSTFIVNLESRYGGLMVPQPRGVSRLDNV